jgi:hypothetical protein
MLISWRNDWEPNFSYDLCILVCLLNFAELISLMPHIGLVMKLNSGFTRLAQPTAGRRVIVWYSLLRTDQMLDQAERMGSRCGR